MFAVSYERGISPSSVSMNFVSRSPPYTWNCLTLLTQLLQPQLVAVFSAAQTAAKPSPAKAP
jgi:hypothetical protein